MNRQRGREARGLGGRHFGRWCALACLLGVAQAWAFDAPEDSAGPLTARIAGPSRITVLSEAVPFRLVIENSADAPVTGTVQFSIVPTWRVTPAEAHFETAASAATTLEFSVLPGDKTYNALYPVHALLRFRHEARDFEVHPIALVEATHPNPPRPERNMPWQPLPVAPGRPFALWRAPIHRAVVQVFGEEPVIQPVAWTGSEGRTRAHLGMNTTLAAKGESFAGIALHPPWFHGQAGTLLVEFPLTLPEAETITLASRIAIRQQQAAEPPSDGITFRVRVVSPADADGAPGAVLFERHTASKALEPCSADLTAYAGQSVRIQLECHPGPENNTTCDLGYWAEPTLLAGSQATAMPPPKEAVALYSQDDLTIEALLGERGLLDGGLRIDRRGEAVEIAGFEVQVLGDRLDQPSSWATLDSVERTDSEEDVTVTHRFSSWAGSFDLVARILRGKPYVRVGFSLENVPPDAPWHVTGIEDIATGPWNADVRRVYAGVGNVIEEPAAFRLPFDGHRMATSYVGLDFGAGTAVVQAVDTPPRFLDVNPGTGHYSLHAAHDTTFTIIPAANVWEAAAEWRRLDGRTAPPGVAQLAGRFVFDLWGGHYGASKDALEQAFRYGLTHSMVVWHNWQRWGYDYRLPEIWPPNPRFGSLDEFQALAQACKDHGVLFAPHDNYIDFYPDAPGYTYADIAFTASGEPVRGWLNEGRDAQAYRFRSDRVEPFLEENVRRIKAGCAATAFFIDVWSSIRPYDYWGWDGSYHTAIESRDTWARHFNWIRDSLGGNAPQISESGHDQLVGALDGAQTNHLRVDQPDEKAGYYAWSMWNLGCADAERVPWIDAVHHHRFVLHGAGYDPRYRAGLDGELHGIYSDDYVCTEVLTGHPGMVSRAFGRDVVRKYWLLDPLMTALAGDTIETVDFANDDIHRQCVHWSGGARVWVNRAEQDWHAAGHVLPQYGFYATAPVDGGRVEAAIERIDGAITGWSRSPGHYFIDARPAAEERLSASLRPGEVRLASPGRIYVTLDWEVRAPLEKDYRVFLHFVDEDGEILFQGDYTPETPTSTWKGRFVTQSQAGIPADVRLGEDYELRAGLFAPSLRRVPLEGLDDGNRAIRLGRISLEGQEGKLLGILWEAYDPPAEPPHIARLNSSGEPIALAGVETDGAFRLSPADGGLLLTPLPEGRLPFSAVLELGPLPWQLEPPVEVWAESGDGNEVRVAATVKEDNLHLACEPGVWRYLLRGAAQAPRLP